LRVDDRRGRIEDLDQPFGRAGDGLSDPTTSRDLVSAVVAISA